MTVKFVVQNDNEEKEIVMESNNTILSLKNRVIELFNLNCKCIDLFIKTERPIRGMGKYTLEDGIIQRSMDSYKMDKFNLEEKTVLLNFKQLDEEYSLNINRKKNTPGGKYLPPGMRNKKREDNQVKQKPLNLDDINEFPPLC